MTDQVTTNVRVVRCPRCRRLLTELANVPVYQCGGCGTILQAKKCKNDTKDTGLHIHETDKAQKNELEHVSDDKEAHGSNQEEMVPSTGELPLDENCGSDQNEIHDNIRDQSRDIKFSSEVATQLTCHGHEESSPAVRKETEFDKDECYLETNNGGDQNGKQPVGVSEVTSSAELNHHGSGELSLVAGAHSEVDLEQNNGRNQPKGVSSSEKVTSSTELNHHESEESSAVAGAHSEVDLEQNNGRNQSGYGYCNGKKPGVVSSFEEVTSSAELNHHESEESSAVVGAHSEVDLEHNNGRIQSGYGYCNGKKPGVVSSFEEVTSSAELNHHETEESSAVAGAHSEVDLEQTNGRNQSGYGYCNGKKPGGVSSSEEVSSSAELNHHESEESSPVAGAHSELLEQNNGRNQSEYGYRNGKQPGGVNFYDEVALSTDFYHNESEESSPPAGVHSEVDENRSCLEQNRGNNQNEFGDYEREWSGNVEFSNEVPFSAELSCQEIEESSPEFGTNTELDENFKNSFIFGSLSVENLLAASPGDSIITAQMPLGESILTDNHRPPHSDQLEESQKRALNGYDYVSSVDALENIALANPSYEFSVMLGEVPKSPTTRSYYAYDGSVSSYDGTEDQVPDLHLPLSKRKFKEAESGSTKEMPRRDELVNTITNNNPEMQYQAWNCSSIPSEKKHYAMKGSKWCQDELPKSTRHGHQVRSRMKFETDEHRSRVPFYSRGCEVGYGNGCPSNYGRNEFQCSASFHLSNKPEYLEEEKMELLKMVYELQDQLDRTLILQGKANERFSGVAAITEKQLPSYYDCVASEVQICNGLSNTRYPERCNQGRSWPHPSRNSRIPFSAKASINRHQVDRSCLHCSAQDWHFSAPFPPHICYNKSQHTAHPSQRCYDLYRSSPSSPQHYTGSEFSLRGCDSKSDDHWQTNHHEVKKYYRERHHLVKRHVRPVAGGSPFLGCYVCSKLLQLPADFFLFRRRCHQLRCSACSVILKLSLQKRTRIVRYTDFTPDTIAPPPSEVDDCSNANNGKLASVSSTNNCSLADPVSCSDDYEPPFCKSCSTEGEPFSVMLPFQVLERDSNGRKMSSSSSFEPMEERKKRRFFKESRNKYKNPVKSLASARPSSKMSKAVKLSSEIEELPPKAGSALHRLMGYSSPSEVMDS